MKQGGWKCTNDSLPTQRNTRILRFHYSTTKIPNLEIGPVLNVLAYRDKKLIRRRKRILDSIPKSMLYGTELI